MARSTMTTTHSSLANCAVSASYLLLIFAPTAAYSRCDWGGGGGGGRGKDDDGNDDDESVLSKIRRTLEDDELGMADKLDYVAVRIGSKVKIWG